MMYISFIMVITFQLLIIPLSKLELLELPFRLLVLEAPVQYYSCQKYQVYQQQTSQTNCPIKPSVRSVHEYLLLDLNRNIHVIIIFNENQVLQILKTLQPILKYYCFILTSREVHAWLAHINQTALVLLLRNVNAISVIIIAIPTKFLFKVEVQDVKVIVLALNWFLIDVDSNVDGSGIDVFVDRHCQRQRYFRKRLIGYDEGIVNCVGEILRTFYQNDTQNNDYHNFFKHIFYLSTEEQLILQMKNNSFTKKIEESLIGTNKKFRPVRQSQPNFLSNQILNDVQWIKDYHKNRQFKSRKQPRLTEVETAKTNPFLSPDFKIDESRLSPKRTFLSPSPFIESRTMKKSSSSIYMHSEIVGSRNLMKKNSPAIQLKNRKSPTKNNKQSLNMIEQMLLNYGINVNKNNEKKEKEPRLSQPVFQQCDDLQNCNKKSNGSLTNININEELEESFSKNLKETISTSASFQGFRQVKISDFELGKDLGKGKFGRVKVAKHKKTGLMYSLKIIKKAQIKGDNIIDQLIKQIKIQSFVNHSHIVKLYTIFDDKQSIYLLQQLCFEGNLYSIMQKKIKFSEDQTSHILKYVCEGVNQLHQLNIIHRDIKPQNIVMCNGMAKICDFGWSTQIKQSMRQTFCGTPLYVSPQLLSGNLYNEKVDLWAIGILGYEMLTGNIPFRIKSQRDLMKIVQKQITYPSWMGSEAKQFLQSVLEKDPKNRKQISQIVGCPFLNRPYKKK